MKQNMTKAGERLRSISETLTGARRAAQALPGFPGPLPPGFVDAYEVQRLSRAAWPDRVAGWKVGGVPAAFIEKSGETRLAGPIFSASVAHAVTGNPTQMPVFESGFAAIEPEFVVQLGKIRAEDRLFIGAEIASSPLPAINDIGPIAVISDFGNNNGLLIGAEVEDWQDASAQTVTVETHIDGVLVGSKVLTDIRINAFDALEFIFAHAREHDIALTPGTFISTGAITGVHEAPTGAKSTLDFGGLGSLDIELVAAKPLA